MDVQELAIDGVFHTYDTTVIWGFHADTICFLFNLRVRCFYNVNWKHFDRDTHDKVLTDMQGVGKASVGNGLNQTVSLKQDKYNELYVIRFIYGDAGVIIYATNVVFGIPSYVFRTVSLHK